MKHTIENIQHKIGAKGGSYQLCTLKDENGIHTEASTFDLPTAKIGDVVEGEIVKNGQYTNFKIKASAPAARGNSVGINKAMDKKKENIEEAQNRKDTAIRLSSAMSNAVLLVTTFYPEVATTPNIIDKETYIATKIKKWRAWFIENHGDIKDIPESAF